MRCAFCRYDFGAEKSPAYCRRCYAGLNGLTDGQMATIMHDLKGAERGGTVSAVLGSFLIVMAIISAPANWGWPFIVAFSVAAALMWVLAIGDIGKAADLKWMLTWWGKQGQPTESEAKQREPKDIASIEAIRRLAELRDQGILTQEEFEQQKKKLL